MGLKAATKFRIYQGHRAKSLAYGRKGYHYIAQLHRHLAEIILDEHFDLVEMELHARFPELFTTKAKPNA